MVTSMAFRNEQMHPGDMVAVSETIEELIQSGDALWSSEYRFRRSDGSYATVLDRAFIVRDEEGRAVRMIGALEDVTERRAAEAALRSSESLYRELVRSLPAALYTCDAEGHITLVNAAATKLWGRQPELGREQWCGAWRIFEPNGRPIAEEDSPMARSIRGEQDERGREIVIERRDGTKRYVLPHPHVVRDANGVVIQAINMLVDITERREAEVEMDRLNKQLLQTSRAAGMAEVATNVLHNVGNVLNSVNVSANLAADVVKKSKARDLARVVALLDEHQHDLGDFITRDPKGKNLPAFLKALNVQLERDRTTTIAELASLRGHIDHIKSIVVMQQSYAKVSGVTELLDISDLVEDSIRMNACALTRHRVEIIRDFQAVGQISVEKHKVLQILVNLITNAKHACDVGMAAEKRVTIGIRNGGNSVKISVADNGIGIAPANLARIFNHGFTTKKDGHGFGLHGGALAAREMGGALSVESAGLGTGAAFILELPCAPKESTPLTLPS